ncbi:phage tail sheath subtilisin-like domain-containing protein [bacterium]|nr:phage tail sheath subtilisin-like domain-containing protein [bacterium]
MAFQTSPGINVSEVDLTSGVPAVGTTEGAIAGVFRWGPINERILVTSEQELVQRFGEPSTRYTASYAPENLWTNHETFLTAANFLSYSDALFVTRAVSDSAVIAGIGDADGYKAKYYGELGNSIQVSHCDSTKFAPASIGTSVVNINTGAVSQSVGNFSGFDDLASAGTLKKGDVITVAGQSFTLAADATVDGGGTGTAYTFESDAAPTSYDHTVDTDGGVYIHDATDTLGTSIIQLGSSVTIAKGTPIAYTSPSYDDLVGLTEKTYFAIPVTVAAATTFDFDDIADATEVITITDHGYTTGDRVVYNQNSQNAITGLVDGTKYHVQVVTSGSIKLYNEAPAIGVDAIDLTAPASGAGYKLTQVGIETVSATNMYKLADTYTKAIAYSETNQNNVQITALNATGGTNILTSKAAAVTAQATFVERYTGIANIVSGAYTKQWGDADIFDSAPDSGSVHVVVKDSDGKITGTANTILERFENVSLTSGAKKIDGTSNFLSEVLYTSSNWISLTDAGSNALTGAVSASDLVNGTDGDDEASIAIGKLALAYDLYKDAADVDISFILQGRARTHVLANYIIDNVAEVRRDCVAFISPEYTSNTASAIVTWAANLTASTFAVVDSGYKYQYDKYSDVYRWVPLNGDIAGLCARTDDLRDPWFSPAGYSRGNVKNVVKLNVNPNKAQRDLLYKNGINPVITQPGQGTVLFGDKTYAGTTSAFDRINVRRLFIVLEKTIGQAAKSTLFEFNDEFTRASFVNLVEPFLRDVQGRRGIYDFKVVCDETNNTGGVIDANQFVGDIYIKPARSINFIQLNFVAVRSGVEFSEIVGAA